MRRLDLFHFVAAVSTLIVVGFIVFPLVEMIRQPTAADLKKSLADADVRRAIWLSLSTSGCAAIICFLFGTPFAYLLARRDFRGKRFVESVVDLPIMIPHPVIGIAILSLFGREHWMGRLAAELGVRVMGSLTGIVIVLTFVGLPFYINTVKNGIEAIPVRLENVSRSLGAGPFGTFWRVTFPLAWRSVIVGMILCTARAVSEFGAVVIVAYHPMTAPVMIYERFTAYGLRYSQPVAVWLIFVCLGLFLMLRWLNRTGRERA